MVKKGLLALLISSSLIYLSCSSSPTYKRQDIERVIKNICKDEFNLEVGVWDVDQTLWIYVPYEKILDENNQMSQKFSDDSRRVYLTLERTILSINKPPKFYYLIFSEIKNQGYDIYYVGFVPDIIKLYMNIISLQQMQERRVSRVIPNPSALSDTEGHHILPYNLTMGEFISYLIRQDIENKFTSPEVKEAFELNDLGAHYHNNQLSVTFDIRTIKESGITPFNEAKKTIKKFLNIYASFEEISEIVINDTANNKKRLYSKRALMEE